MTLEAIHFHARKGVTTLTELAGCIDGYWLATCVGAHMTGYTFDETVPFRANALVHSSIALVH
jgi:hypothetical protein